MYYTSTLNDTSQLFVENHWEYILARNRKVTRRSKHVDSRS